MSEATEDLAPAGAAGPEARPDAPAVTPPTAEAHEASEPNAAAEVAEVAAAETGDGEGESVESSPGQQDAEGATSAGGDGAPGKRKRRRRKRRKGEGEASDAEATAAGEAAPEPRRRRDAPVAPFMRFFVGAHAGRKHGFAVGEVVAGRVKEVANGSIAIDLFGKAMAYADEFEPREAPPPVLEPREVLPEVTAAAVVTEAAPAPEGEASEVVAASSDAEAVEAPAPALATGATEAMGGDAQAVEATADAASDDAVTSVATDAPASDLEADADAEADAETTASGDVAAPGHGPQPPVPVVPDSFPRLEPPGLGQVFRGRVGAVAESGHIAIVNRDIDRQGVLADLSRYRDERRRVQGLVFGWNRGGFDVLVDGIRAFCPASAMTLEELEDPAVLLGQKLEFLLPASQSVTKDIIVSRRSILERQLRKKAKELVRSLEPGQRLKGRVTQVREFGVFVDIGGVEGLVHQSELSFAHGVRPSDVAQPGDEVEVKVLRVGGPEGGRRDRVERISLSMKALLPDPWDAHRELLKEGSAQLGKVVRTTDFGAFIELTPAIEGLLHITELGRDLKHANQVVKEGDELPVVIERVDRGARRIALSKLTTEEYEEYKAAVAAGETPPSNIRPGSRIKVKVTRVEARGLLVRVAGVLGKRARGYVPSSELAGERGDLRKAYPIGAELEVKIVSLDRDGGLRCSPKALLVDEERKAVKDYRREAAKQGFGTFGDLLRAKLGQSDEKQ
ncbi:MAG: S1 RNA-binding domain-containing protein [Polyangiales bacterium]